MTTSLSVIVPVLNEAGNIPTVVERLRQSLRDIDWEVIFVDDDSRDASRELLVALAREDPRVRVITRIGRRGLSSAVIEGALSSSARYLAVMDGDLQHDDKLLREMLDLLERDQADVVVGSRFLEGARREQAFGAGRERMSRLGIRLSRHVIKTTLTDPLSGFFMLKRSVFDGVVRELSGMGFKILLDILSASKTPPRVRELPFRFGSRLHGESKIDSLAVLEFGLVLAHRWFGRYVPVRFLLFATVGGLGVGVHVAILGLLYKGMEVDFYFSQATAALLTMAFNFTLNNVFTYRDRRLGGLLFFRGMLLFYLVCSVGALTNFQLAEFLFRNGLHWVLAGVSGALVGAVWNYAMNSIFTWGIRPSGVTGLPPRSNHGRNP